MRAEVHENRSNGGTIVRHVVVRDDHLSIRFPILSGLEIMRGMRATSRNGIRITVSLSLFLYYSLSTRTNLFISRLQ